MFFFGAGKSQLKTKKKTPLILWVDFIVWRLYLMMAVMQLNLGLMGQCSFVK